MDWTIWMLLVSTVISSLAWCHCFRGWNKALSNLQSCQERASQAEQEANRWRGEAEGFEGLWLDLRSQGRERSARLEEFHKLSDANAFLRGILGSDSIELDLSEGISHSVAVRDSEGNDLLDGLGVTSLAIECPNNGLVTAQVGLEIRNTKVIMDLTGGVKND